MNTKRLFVLSFVALLSFAGCSSPTSISTVSINDPDVGVALEVPVGSGGSFTKKVEKEGVVSTVSGTVSDLKEDVYSVKLVYERKSSTDTGSVKTEMIETTFTAKSDADIPIGKNLSKPEAEQTVADNPLTNLTVKLLKGK